MMVFRAVVLPALMLASSAVLAGDLEVHPLRLSLSAGQENGALYVRNAGKEAVQVQVQILRWTQGPAGDAYEATTAALANPPMFRLSAGNTQVIRVGLLQAPGGASETAYRVFLQEVPDATRGTQGVRTLLRVSLPVFVAATSPLPPALRARRGDKGTIEIENTGNVHVQITAIEAKDAGGRTFATDRGSMYVLPGQRNRWILKPGGQAVATAARFVLETDHGPLVVTPDQ